MMKGRVAAVPFPPVHMISVMALELQRQGGLPSCQGTSTEYVKNKAYFVVCSFNDLLSHMTKFLPIQKSLLKNLPKTRCGVRTPASDPTSDPLGLSMASLHYTH